LFLASVSYVFFPCPQDLGSKMADLNLSDTEEQLVASQENQYLSSMLSEAQAKNIQLQVRSIGCKMASLNLLKLFACSRRPVTNTSISVGDQDLDPHVLGLPDPDPLVTGTDLDPSLFS
jgi:hypothetical protein